MENDYRITKLHGTFIGDNRIPDLPVGEKTKVFSSTNGKTAWVDLPEGGKSVPPTLNLMNMEDLTVRTSITEEEKTNLEKGLYNSVLYVDMSLGTAGLYSMYFPETAVFAGEALMFSKFDLSVDDATRSATISSSSSYMLNIGEKGADGTYPITIEKILEATFGGGGGGGIATIKSLPFPQTIHSTEGFELLWGTIDGGDVIYAGNVKGKILNYSLALAYTSINPSAQGEETFATLTGLFEGYGYGVMELKKDVNNIPQFKSFTTWLPPVTANSDGKALIVTDGNAQWTTIPRYEHTITIKNSAGKILWTQTMRNSSNTIVNSYTNLKTLFGEATYAGFGEYCQLDLRGGTEATDKLIKADGTEATLASLGAIVYTDVCFLPK